MNSYKSNRGKYALSVLAITIGAALSTTAFSAEEEKDESVERIERISVTGSRIKSRNILAPSQITTVSGEQLELTGHINAMDALLDLPSMAGGLTNETAGFNYANTGMNTLNLRNLGDQRTLVLVNGRRFVSSDVGEILVDINSIPTSLIKSVDITTGGGSATYGSGAIAGVVNFVLKDNFEGVEAEARYTESGKSDNKADLLRLTLGGNFDQDKGNVVISFEKSSSDGLGSKERGIAYGKFDPDNNILNEVVPSSYAPNWAYSAGNSRVVYDGGNLRPWNDLTDGYINNDSRTISTPIERTVVNALSHYYINDDVRVFAEFSYAKTETSNPSDLYYVGSSNRGEPLTLDNPFIPDELRKLALSEDVDQIGYRGRLNEFGTGGFDAERFVTRYVIGFDGTFMDEWDWEVSYNYGEVTNDQGGRDVNQLAFRKATDVISDPVTGDPICRDEAFASIGCVATNVFAPFTDDMMDFWTNLTTLDGKLEEETLAFTISNSSLYTLPAGDVGFAAGYETRKEYAEEHPDSVTQSGFSGGLQIDSLEGNYEVEEYFIEFNIPLLADMTYVKLLDINLAGRSSDYSHTGKNDSWQLGSRWQVNDEIRFRAQLSQAFRAPTIADMFNGTTRMGLSLGGVDPCHNITETTAGNGVSQAHADACRQIPGIAQAIQNGGVFNGDPEDDDVDRYQYFGSSPDLEVEKAKTTTIGFIYTPDYLQDFTLSLDYYKIVIDNIITGVDHSYKAERCLEGLADFCRSVERNPTTGVIDTMHNFVFNLAGREVAGYSLEVDYTQSLNDYGELKFELLYDYVIKHNTQSLPDAPWDDELGQLPFFEHKANFSTTYSFENIKIDWTIVYQGAIQDNKNADYHNNDIEAVVIHNAQARYTFGEDDRYSVYAGIDNVFDQDPPFLPEGYKNGRVHSATAAPYSRIGRMFYIGSKVSF
jgi:outer membrane receptor protein involved in Fe transport